MKPRVRRILSVLGVTLIALIILLFLAENYAEGKLESSLSSINGKAGSVKIGLLRGSIRITELQVPATDSIALDSLSTLRRLYVSEINVRGIGLLRLLFQKGLTINQIEIDSGELDLRLRKKVKDSTSSPPLKDLALGQITVRNLKVRAFRDTVCEYTGTANITLGGLSLIESKRMMDPFAYKLESAEASLKNFRLNPSKGSYTLNINRIHYNHGAQKLQIDCVSMDSKYSKQEFMARAGRQIDRYKLKVPHLQFDQLNLMTDPDTLVSASRVLVDRARLFSYRDKRLPFKNKVKPMPMELLRGLKFGIRVDTLEIKDTFVEYEEFPEAGFASGKVFFTHLDAMAVGITNRDQESSPDNIKVKASARLMGTGLLQAAFTIPMKPGRSYAAEGSISKFDLPALNPVLENLVFVSIESGTLNSLNFQFTYDQSGSNGKVVINYNNLKIKSLNKTAAATTNRFKTFVANTIVKNDKAKNVDKANRTGSIEVTRDQRKSIFNLWWKSVFEGIKRSVINPEKGAAGK